MLLEIMTICSLISVAPYYDCSDKWEIRLYDEPPAIQCNNLDNFYVKLGCANINRGIIHVIDFPEHRDQLGQTILQHELKHMICQCNFH